MFQAPSLPWLCTALLAFLLPCASMAQHRTFEIVKGGEVVGSVAASRIRTGERTLYVMSSYSMINVLWKQTVVTAMTTEYLGNELRACMTSIRLNGALRDSSHMAKDAEGFRCHVFPQPPFRHTMTSAWTTARMYYEEPIGQESVFVESVLTPCSLSLLSAGNYLLTFPNGAESRYVYSAGLLEEIHVDRTFIKLLFRRKHE